MPLKSWSVPSSQAAEKSYIEIFGCGQRRGLGVCMFHFFLEEMDDDFDQRAPHQKHL
jgi:hypothetical protein